ncbi:MAG: exopolysaccharide biosynthesis protein [Rhodovibrionaceae bacterium]|nr:exopolysaccharide biosynthesis protein [Rhodovibrionaceae bacterium]
MNKRIPTSAVLETLVQSAPRDEVTLGWIVEHLSERSFGVMLLVIALLALVPGISPLAGLLVAVIAAQMIMARPTPLLPGPVLRRRFATARLARVIGRLIPFLKRIERLVRPRWRTPFEATKRTIGFITLLLGATLLVPIPFSHFIPALTLMLLAFAFLEEDGILLCFALIAALISLGITATAAWSVIEVSLSI